MEISKLAGQVSFDTTSTDLTFVWNREFSMTIMVNRIVYELMANDIIILTNHHQI
ncbi:hypothetical protein [Flavobacterium crocinum]|uniref:hypothetical protein n=1 Tax=Flavobacterium crocinum TaxID=2183896 RepID=UPI00142D4CC1|nr:hypothetical protein [Flavobacterium crocinum]